MLVAKQQRTLGQGLELERPYYYCPKRGYQLELEINFQFQRQMGAPSQLELQRLLEGLVELELEEQLMVLVSL